MVRVLVADCNDSFVYNLVEILRKNSLCSYQVHSVAECVHIPLEDFDALLLSPGPGIPKEVEGLYELIEKCYRSHPILGICLGHQAIATFFGGELSQINAPLHGHSDQLTNIQTEDPLFKNYKEDARIGRYHSWIVAEQTLPKTLKVLAHSQEDHSIMALRHLSYPIWGLQFHPESYISTDGETLVNNWLEEANSLLL